MEYKHLFLIFVFTGFSSEQTLNDTEQLVSDLMKGYNKIVRPILDQENAIYVNFSYAIGSIQEFDTMKGQVSVSVALYLSWIDEHLRWTPKEYNKTKSLLLPINQVWTPGIILANAAESIQRIYSDWMLIRYFDNGRAEWFPGGQYHVSCSVDIKYYPFDTQFCRLRFMPYMYRSSELRLFPKKLDGIKYMGNGEWDIVENSITKISPKGHNLIQVKLNLARRPTFVVVNVILPIVLMSFLNTCVFLLPAESGERMSYAVTILLSMAVYLTIVSDNIPKTSRPVSLLCYFIGSHLLSSSAICLATILNLRLFYKDDTATIPKFIGYLIEGKASCNTQMCQNFSAPTNLNDEEAKTNGHTDMFNIQSQGKGTATAAKKKKANKNTQQITWKDVSILLDKILIVLSMSCLLGSCITFGIILYNKQE